MTSSKMGEELRNAAVRGDVDFLKKCVESKKLIEYYLSFYPREDDQSGRGHHGNIFHMATVENQEEFIREVMGILPQEAKQQLLVQSRTEKSKWNPLHVAAYVGNVEIIKIFLNVYQEKSHLLELVRPWLLNNSSGDNPCFVAVFRYHEECALEIYKMDTELISNIHSGRGSSLVCEALQVKMSKLALEILRSPHLINCNGYNGNIFHIAAKENKEEFIREAMGNLPQETKQQLLVQPDNEISKWNPLHAAANVGNVEIVKMFLDVYRRLPDWNPSHLLESERPWLSKDSRGNNPCFGAVFSYQEECALEIYKIDTESISNMPSARGSSLVYEAVHTKMSKLALEILRSNHPISCGGGNDGYSPFHSIHLIEGSEESEEIFRRLLQTEPGLIRQINENEDSAFHIWAFDGKIWPFKILLDCKDIMPDVNNIFTDLVSSKNQYGDNPFHNLAEYAPGIEVIRRIPRTEDVRRIPRSEDVIRIPRAEDVGRILRKEDVIRILLAEDVTKIAELLIDIYKKESPSLSNNEYPWLEKNDIGDTPLSLAIDRKNKNLITFLQKAAR